MEKSGRKTEPLQFSAQRGARRLQFGQVNKIRHCTKVKERKMTTITTPLSNEICEEILRLTAGREVVEKHPLCSVKMDQ
jgi:hypothetical protein